ncbi:restriction endonuclease [Bacillus infantis]|uniref:restriction endonuclease n=1 Tax=Bacillus infantis TaxID=324767 RepID=UPI003CF68815
MNILENIVTELSPEEFEVYCLNLLMTTSNSFEKCKITHNQVTKTYDGNYQLDGLIEFTHLGINYKAVVECKKYKNKIKRSQVQILYDTVQKVGANKGIFISTSSFQEGAMEYARTHGITLLQIVDGFVMTIQNALPSEMIHNFCPPKYSFAMYNLDLKCPSGFVFEGRTERLRDLLLKVYKE